MEHSFTTSPEENQLHTKKESRFHPLSNSRMILGLIVVFFGLFILAKTMGFLEVDLTVVWSTFWPMIIVIIGLSLISKNSWVSNLIAVIVTLFVIWVLVMMVLGSPRVDALKDGSPKIIFSWEGKSRWVQLDKLDQCLRSLKE